MPDVSNDKLYILIILIMIGGFIYWHQTRLDRQECGRCNERYKNNNKVSRRSHKKSYKKPKSDQMVKNSDSLPQKTSKYPTKNGKRNKEKNSVSFKDIDEEKDIDNNTDISLESLDSSDHASIVSGKRRQGVRDLDNPNNTAKSHKTQKIDDNCDDDSVDSLDI